MLKLKKIFHNDLYATYHGVSFSKFSFESLETLTNDKIIDLFIKSNSFSFESLNEKQKNNIESNDYLRKAFDIDKIQVTDFKKIDKSKVKKILLDFTKEFNHEEDRLEFAKLLDEYFKCYNELSNEAFYIIDKDWFNENDEKLLNPESWIYTYYFIIIHIERKNNILFMTEWSYD